MKKKFTQFRWFATMILFVTAMVMPSVAWAEDYDENGFGSESAPYEPATMTTEKYDINGDGVNDEVYEIGNAGQLYWFANYVNSGNYSANAILTNNITINNDVLVNGELNSASEGSFRKWTPIGNDISIVYTGTFDGNSKTISGLYYSEEVNKDINSVGTVYVGLFGHNKGNISNVVIDNSYICIKGYVPYVGSIAGNNNNGKIINCKNYGLVNGKGELYLYIGGLCGNNTNGGYVSECTNYGKITAVCSNMGYIGGLSGNNGNNSNNNYTSKIENSKNAGYVTVTDNTTTIISTGGVCGRNLSEITGCINSGNIEGGDYSGGVCGFIDKVNNNNGKITNCYNTGTVKGTSEVGGICGSNYYAGTIENCYSAGSVSGTSETSNVGGVCGVNYTSSSISNGSKSTIRNCYFDNDKYSGDAVGSSGTSGIVEKVEGKSSEYFSKGGVCYLLNNGITDGSQMWYQTIDSGTKEAYPNLDNTNKESRTVYQCNPCTALYSNTEGVTQNHSYVNDGNGFLTCTACGDKRYQQATQNESGEYEIGNAGQLCWFAGLVNGTLNDGTQQNLTAKGVLTGNIDLASVSNWTPIGNESSKFSGTFDGKNFKVQRLSITQQGSNSGLFGFADNASMQNICIDGNITLTSTSYTEGYGSIVGRMDNSIISNCHSSVNFSIESEMAASTECIGHIGGIVGKMHETSSAVQGCSYSGTINLGNNNVKVAAGIVGYAIRNKVPITNCSFTGTIRSTYEGVLYMGGIFGYTNSGSDVKVTNCLQAGTLEKPGDSSLTGILIGQINNGYGANAVTNNYYTSSTFNVIGQTSGTPTTTPATQCTIEQLQSGEICYRLNGSQSDGGWGQQIGTDGYPVPGSDKTVYEVNLLCGGVHAVGKTYVNSNEDVTIAHELPKTANFNAEKNIYNKVCQREGCGETLYYADAAGTIEATLNADATEFTVANYPLQDSTTYDNRAVFTATNFTYTRTFSNTEWTTWYVPFDLTLTEEICNRYDFSRINNVHQYDTDNDGTADKTVVESFRQIPGVTLKANYPYLVRAKSDADFTMSLPLTNVVPALAETNSIDCQSVDFSYTFMGTYTGMGEGGSGYYDPYTLWTDGTWRHFQSLDPMRHYLTVTPRNSFYASATSLRSIMLSVIGDEGTTGIVNIYDEERRAKETYDLGGRRIPAGSQRNGFYIENGKVIYKK